MASISRISNFFIRFIFIYNFIYDFRFNFQLWGKVINFILKNKDNKCLYKKKAGCILLNILLFSGLLFEKSLFCIIGILWPMRSNLHDFLFEQVVVDDRTVLYTRLVGVDGMYGIVEEACDAFAVGDAQSDEGENSHFRCQ